MALEENPINRVDDHIKIPVTKKEGESAKGIGAATSDGLDTHGIGTGKNTEEVNDRIERMINTGSYRGPAVREK